MNKVLVLYLYFAVPEDDTLDHQQVAIVCHPRAEKDALGHQLIGIFKTSRFVVSLNGRFVYTSSISSDPYYLS